MYEELPKDFIFPVFQQLKDSRASYKAHNRTHIETHGSKKKCHLRLVSLDNHNETR